jgi:hypothetical protein
VRDAFRAMRRQLQDHERRQAVKRSPHSGSVS